MSYEIGGYAAQVMYILKEALGSYLFDEYAKKFGKRAEDERRKILQRGTAQYSDETYYDRSEFLKNVDTRDLLKLIIHNWDLRNTLGHVATGHANELEQHRHTPAHQKNLDYEELYRMVDTSRRLLREIDYSFKEHLQRLDEIAHKIFSYMNETTSINDQHSYHYYSHIPLATHFVPRPDIFKPLTRLALSDDATQNIIVIHGMGGSGKSTLSRQLCELPVIHKKYPDGILWMHLGQAPNIDGKLSEWLDILGIGIDVRFPTTEMLKRKLFESLAEKQVLLILDDGWNVSDVSAFIPGGNGPKAIITSRDAYIADAFNAHLFPLPTMTEIEAVELLESWADDSLKEVDLSVKNDIVQRLGYLPVALKLAGTQLKTHPPDRWLERVNIRQLQTIRPEDVHDSLEKTIQLSLDALDEHKQRLFFALGIIDNNAIPLTAIIHLWRGMGNLYDEQVTEILHDLHMRALLQFDGIAIVNIHDLIHEFIQENLDDTSRIEAHKAILRAYKDDAGDRWGDAANDGYLFDNLASHMIAAGHVSELHSLLVATPEWMEAKAREFHTDSSYLQDLDTALKQFMDPLSPSQVVPFIELHIARHTMLTRVSVLSDTNLETLVWLGRTDEALSHARLRQTLIEQIRGLVAVYCAILDKGDIPSPDLKREITKLTNSSDNPIYLSGALRELMKVYIHEQGNLEAITDRIISTCEAITHLEVRLVELGKLLNSLVEHKQSHELVLEITNIVDQSLREYIDSGSSYSGDWPDEQHYQPNIRYHGDGFAWSSIFDALKYAEDFDRFYKLSQPTIENDWQFESVLSFLSILLDRRDFSRAIDFVNQSFVSRQQVRGLMEISSHIEDSNHRHNLLKQSYLIAVEISDVPARIRTLFDFVRHTHEVDSSLAVKASEHMWEVVKPLSDIELHGYAISGSILIDPEHGLHTLRSRLAVFQNSDNEINHLLGNLWGIRICAHGKQYVEAKKLLRETWDIGKQLSDPEIESLISEYTKSFETYL